MPKKSIVEAILSKAAAAGSGLVSVVSGILAALLVVYSGYVLYDNLYMQKQAESNWDLLQYRPEIIDDDSVPLSASALAALNEDYRAWITLYDTHIDYPVMQGSNDLYYASHDINKKSSLTGAIYLAAGNSADFSDSYNLIYGHHMDGDAMFGPLDHYTEKGYPESHREGVLVTQNQVFDLYVIGVMLTDAYASELYSPGGDQMADVLSFLEEGLGSGTKYFDEKAAAEAEKIVALSTCESAETNGRLVVFAKMDPRRTENFPPDDLNQAGGGNSGNPTPENPESGNSSGTPDTGSNPANPAAGTESSFPGAAGPQTMNPAAGSESALETIPGGISAGVQANTEAEGNRERITDTEVTGSAEETQEIEEIDDEQTPLARLFNRFQPTGGSFGRRAWALLNLICLILTIYLLLPILHLKAKYSRKKQMRKVNELEEEMDRFASAEKMTVGADTESGTKNRTSDSRKAEDEKENETSNEDNIYRIKKFVKRFRIGLVLEIVICVVAVIAFILTEDIRLPMVLIDRWTPLMILLLLLCWITDVRLVRYRNKEEREEQPDGDI